MTASLPPLPARLSTGGSGSHIVALLGPTNTGKTHRALERMVQHGGGMIGLPLRLLAREVYDRLCARVGEPAVALLTGEERIVPHKASYWVCTVESMPLTRAVPFVAIDEVQLATHHERGHIFTDRILNARGTRETWFLGSDAMRPIIERLTPTAEILTFERFSALRHVDPRPLHALPPRSAIIAFSVSHLYELAEKLRAAHGGVAVVFGALSPKARNAQVALFESGEVQHLVSTDAIGMGLNLSIRHVWFASTRKYDGTEARQLEPWEFGQIAGRAGRHRSDGFFGQTRASARADRFAPWLVESIERQRFAPIHKVYYRHSDLDTSSVEALQAGLMRQPFSKALVHARGLEDERALRLLLREPEIVASVKNSPERVAVLWDVCRVPDYRQLSDHAHARLLGRIYMQLIGRGERLDPDWINHSLSRLEDYQGGIDSMMSRIAHARTWAYIAHRARWLGDPARWRARVLRLEEMLSHALHERLTQQFIDESAGVQVPRPTPHDVRLEGDRVITRTLPLGRVESFSFIAAPEAVQIFGARTTRHHGRRAARPDAEAMATALLADQDDAFGWDHAQRICWRGRPLARLERGQHLHRPKLRLMALDLLEDEPRRAVHDRLTQWLQTQLQVMQGFLADPEEAGPLRGLIYVLRSQFGVATKAELKAQLKGLSAEDRKRLARLKIRLGVRYVYAQKMLKPGFQALRAACLGAWQGHRTIPTLPEATVCFDAEGWPAPLAEALGYPRVGPRCVRVDMLERLLALLRQEVKRGQGPAALPEAAMSWLGCDQPTLEAILTALDYRVRPEGVYPPRRQRRHAQGKPRKPRRAPRARKPKGESP